MTCLLRVVKLTVGKCVVIADLRGELREVPESEIMLQLI
jgi:hypothetical protein